MNCKRTYHGMGVITINGEQRLAVFGGSNEEMELDSVELYNTQTGQWENTYMKLMEPKSGFGSLTIKLADIVSKISGQI